MSRGKMSHMKRRVKMRGRLSADLDLSNALSIRRHWRPRLHVGHTHLRPNSRHVNFGPECPQRAGQMSIACPSAAARVGIVALRSPWTSKSCHSTPCTNLRAIPRTSTKHLYIEISRVTTKALSSHRTERTRSRTAAARARESLCPAGPPHMTPGAGVGIGHPWNGSMEKPRVDSPRTYIPSI